MGLRHVFSLFLIVICCCEAAPVFTKQPSTPEYVSPSGSLDVVCSTQDPSTITWHEDDANKTRILPGTFSITTVSDKSSRLHLTDATSLTIAEVRAMRFCRATDSGGSSIDSNSFEIKDGAAASFVDRPTNETGREGTSVTLPCSAPNGLVPVPQISWNFTRKGSSSPVKVGQVTTTGSTNSLQLDGIHRNQSGTYTCKIENEFDSVMASSTVTVTYPPDVSIYFNPSPKVKRGDSVNVTCRAVSTPSATSNSLLRNGAPIPASSPLKAPSSSVGDMVEWRYTLIASNETEGKYQCEANNTVGTGKSKETKLDVLLPPDKPKIKASNVSNVCWTTGFLGNPPITYYSLSCTTKNNSGCGDKEPVTVTTTVAIPSNNDTLCANLTDTSPSAVYTCSVKASNGAYDVSSDTDVSLEPGKPGRVLLDLVSDVNNTEFTLTWCVSFTGGIPLTQTVVGLPGAVTSNPGFKTDTQKWTVTVTQVEPDTTFNVKVNVTNSEGEAESNEVVVTTTCVPDVVMVTNVQTNSEENTITFTESRTGTCNTNNDYILKNGDTVWASTTTRNGNNVTITFGGVIVPGPYSLTITAKNRNQESAPSAAFQFKKEVPPSTPSPTTEASPTSSGGGGLSTGALVGIIIAVVLIVVIIVLVVVCTFKQRHSGKEEISSSKQQDIDLRTDGRFKEPESAP